MRRQPTRWSSLPALVLSVLVWSVVTRAENAVRFSDAAAEPGGMATIDVILQNDQAIAAVLIYLVARSSDLVVDTISFVTDRYQGTLVASGRSTVAGDNTAVLTLWPPIGLNQFGWINPGSGPIARVRFRVAASAGPQSVAVDSIRGPGGDTSAVTQLSNFSGIGIIYPHVYPGSITIGHPSGQATMSITPDRLNFHGAHSGPAPPRQTVMIRAVGGAPFSWAASSVAPWLHLSPSSGTSPGEVSVGVDIEGLDPGDYYDTIAVTSPEAVNSPLRLPVTLHIESSTELRASPGRLDFQTVQGGANPRSKTLQLETSNGVPLAWSATWGSTWLTLDPSSGNQLGTVQASVDAVGLDTGRYVDTIVVTATGAINSPLKIPVSLFVDTAASIPRPNALGQNRPNPFSTYHDPLTSIAYTMEKAGRVEITLFDILGRRVKRLVSDNLGAGDHLYLWDGRDEDGRTVASGHYFYRMKTAGSTVTRRMVVIK